MKSVSKWFTGLVLTVVVLAALAVVAPVVHAQGEEPPASEAGVVKNHVRLEMAYQRELMRLHRQAERLDGSDDFVARIERIITKIQENGQDPAGVEAALAGYIAQVPTAGAHHREAAGILSEHAGFNAAGKVVDPVAASQTLRTAHEAMDLCRETLKDARQPILAALRALRETLNPKNTP